MKDKNYNRNDIKAMNDQLDEKLQQLKDHNPFKVPDNYFETLPSAIDEKKTAYTRKADLTPTIKFYRLRPAYYIAAAVVVLLATTMFLFKSKLFNEKDNFVELSWEEVYDVNYFAYIDSDIYSLIETLVTADINEYIEEESGNTDADSSLGSDEIIDYLIEENLEETYIY
jgi:hypothetical protein